MKKNKITVELHPYQMEWLKRKEKECKKAGQKFNKSDIIRRAVKREIQRENLEKARGENS
ncbi:MAG: hypothetical protein ACFFDN_14000 [Candidatus Hodarchaeota archaeon]